MALDQCVSIIPVEVIAHSRLPKTMSAFGNIFFTFR